MATTFTTKLNLRKPDPNPVTGDLVDVQADVNDNMDKIDAAFGTAMCTTTTRPSTPSVGQQAYESDTQATIICTSTGPAVWRYISTPRVAALATIPAGSLVLDMVAMQTADHKLYKYNGTTFVPQNNGRANRITLSSGTGITTGDVLQPETIAVPVVTGRIYQLTHTRNEANGGAGNNRFNRYRVSSGTLLATSTQIDDTFVNGLTGGYNTFQITVEWTSTFTGTATFGVSSSVNSGTGLVDSTRLRVLTVTDITPVWAS